MSLAAEEIGCATAGAGPTALVVSPPVQDLQTLLYAVRASWRLAAVSTVALFVVMALAVFALPRAYTATASLLFQAAQKPEINGALPPAEPADTTTVDTAVQLIRSRDLAARVADALHLTAAGKVDRPSLVRALQAGLSVRRPGLTSLVTISYTAADPALAVRVVNAFADQQLATQSEAKLDAARLTARAFDATLDDLRRAALTDARDLAGFRSRHGLYSSRDAELTEAEAAVYGEQLALAKADHEGDEARLVAAQHELGQRDPEGAASDVSLDSPVLQTLRAQHAQLSAQVAGLGRRYGPRYPDLVAASEQLRDVDAGLRAEVRRIANDLQVRSDASRDRAASLTAALGDARERLASGAQASVELDELQRRADASRDVYRDYLARRRQALAAAESAEAPDGRVASRADLSSVTARPHRLALLALAALLASAGGVGVALVRRAGLYRWPVSRRPG
jgi:polysaccharide biosynthesis transport protein